MNHSPATKFDDWKRLIDKTSIKCKLVDSTRWNKIYKDVVFNETMLYYSYENVGLVTIREPYISVTRWPVDNKSFFSFMLDTCTMYTIDALTEDKMKEVVSNLERKYKTCLEAYEYMKTEIDSMNKQFHEMILTKSFEEIYAYMNQKEHELDSMLKDLTKICIF